MAGGSTVIDRTVFGNKRIVMGKFWAGSNVSESTCTTNLRVVEAIFIDVLGSTGQVTYIPTLPHTGSTITLATSAATTTGIWLAIGY